MNTKKINKRWVLSEESKARIPEWNDRWIRIIRSTDPIDFARTRDAVIGMYRAAKFDVDDLRIVHVLSPMQAAIVGLCAAVYWRHREHAATAAATAAATRDATADATYAATYAATHAATAAATHAATADATYDATANATADATADATHAATADATYDATAAATAAATHAATAAATYAATDAATDAATADATDAATANATADATYDATANATADATRAATADATLAATYAATDAATGAATHIFGIASRVVSEKLGRDVTRECGRQLAEWYTYYNGGSEWASWCCFLSFVRDVVGWSCDEHANYAHYENAAIYGGPRYMHKKFVLLSERAAIRKLDADNRLHCEDGPAIGWHCGTEAYYIHGVRVPRNVVMSPELQTIEEIRSDENAEVRRIRIERFSWERYLSESNAKVIDHRRNDIEQCDEALMEVDKERVLVCACPSTARVYAMRVASEVQNCEQAQQWLGGGRIGRRVIGAS